MANTTIKEPDLTTDHAASSCGQPIMPLHQKISAMREARSATANGMLALARKKISATDLEALTKKLNAATRAVTKAVTKGK